MEKEELLRLAYINLTKALKKKPRPRLVRASSARSGPTDAICSRASCCCRWIDSVCIMRLPNRTYCPDDLGPSVLILAWVGVSASSVKTRNIRSYCRFESVSVIGTPLAPDQPQKLREAQTLPHALGARWGFLCLTRTR
jgi:hypothetical protein